MNTVTIIILIVWFFLLLVGDISNIYTAHWQRKVIDAQRVLIEKQLEIQNKAFKSSETLIRIMSDVDYWRNAKLNDKD